MKKHPSYDECYVCEKRPPKWWTLRIICSKSVFAITFTRIFTALCHVTANRCAPIGLGGFYFQTLR